MNFGRPHARTKPFTPGKRFTQHSFAWADFKGSGRDGRDVMAILIAAVAPGTFRLDIDDVELSNPLFGCPKYAPVVV